VQNLAIARALVAAGAKLGLQNSSKETPLSAAKLHRNSEVIRYFEGISNRTVRRESLNALLKIEAFGRFSFNSRTNETRGSRSDRHG
jgi:hypothetical protein